MPANAVVIGKLTRDDREHVCRVRNISDGGVGIEQDGGIAPGDAVTIELRGLSPSPAMVIWVDGRMAGLAFAEPVQLGLASQENGRVLRSPRFAVDRRVTLRIDDTLVEMRVMDIALGGMKLVAGALEVGSMTTIVLHGHETVLQGRICWTSPVASGVQFARPLATQQLTAILHHTIAARGG